MTLNGIYSAANWNESDNKQYIQSVVGTVTEETNDYFATRYWALKKVTIISLLVTGLRKKVTIISLLVIGIWKKVTIISLLVTGVW
jgi:hypothetical protein